MPLSSSLFGTATSKPTPECIIWRLCLNSPKTAWQSALPAAVIRQGGFSNALPLSCLIINHPDLCKIPLIFIPQTVHNFTQRLSRFHSLTVFRISEQSLDYGTAESFVKWKNSLSAQIVHNRSVRSLISNRVHFPDLPSEIAHTGEYSPFCAVSLADCSLPKTIHQNLLE